MLLGPLVKSGSGLFGDEERPLGIAPCVPCRSAATSFGVLMFLAEFEEVNDVWVF